MSNAAAIARIRAALAKKSQAEHLRRVHEKVDLRSPISVRDTTGLLPWQPEQAGRLARSVRVLGSALDASSTGVGKTFSALAVMRELGLSPVVVCPKAVQTSWKRAAAALGVPLHETIGWEKARAGTHQLFDGVDWAPSVKAIIGDEIHRARTKDTLSSTLILAAKRQGIPLLMLSATAAEDPRHLEVIGQCLGLHAGEDFLSWAANFGCYLGDDGLMFSDNPEHLKKLHHCIFPERGFRIRAEDLGDAFPETLITADPYDMAETPEIVAAYEEMEEELADLEARRRRDGNMAENPLTIMIRAAQKVELLKVPLFVSLAKDEIAEGRHVAIFVNYDQSRVALCEKLDTQCTVHGGQTGKAGEVARQKAIDDFQADLEPVIVLNSAAGGVGISLHALGEKPRTSLISPTFNAVTLKQCLGRVHRAGGRSRSVQRLVYCAGTIEESIAASVRKKLDRMDLISDGELSPLRIVDSA